MSSAMPLAWCQSTVQRLTMMCKAGMLVQACNEAKRATSTAVGSHSNKGQLWSLHAFCMSRHAAARQALLPASMTALKVVSNVLVGSIRLYIESARFKAPIAPALTPALQLLIEFVAIQALHPAHLPSVGSTGESAPTGLAVCKMRGFVQRVQIKFPVLRSSMAWIDIQLIDISPF